jgi:predicted Fe-S protein YdhL (DUF1289 family)|tara:strand:+ start:143 stop:271 length:129 start_codon:yes stop_codon:yes gene_type:complete
MGRLESPCINVCKLDDNLVCIGCKRTIEEIINYEPENIEDET